MPGGDFGIQTPNSDRSRSVNRQARLKAGDGERHSWVSYGAVTHVEAAKKHSRQAPNRLSEIETRDEGTETVFCHRVRRVMEVEVTPLRGDKL